MDGQARGSGGRVSAPLVLDHLVYAVPDLEAAVAHFEAKLGAAPRAGGKHDGLGTHNAILSGGAQRYVELIAADPEEPAPAQPRPFGLDRLKRARLVTWAVRSGDIAADVERSRQAGFDPGLVLEVSRQQPNGERVAWKLSLRPESYGDGLVPFVIDWGQAAHPAEAGARCSLEGFRGLHPDPDSIRSALDALGVSFEVAIGSAPELRSVVVGPSGRLELD